MLPHTRVQELLSSDSTFIFEPAPSVAIFPFDRRKVKCTDTRRGTKVPGYGVGFPDVCTTASEGYLNGQGNCGQILKITLPAFIQTQLAMRLWRLVRAKNEEKTALAHRLSNGFRSSK
jgi:hypothetical protein